MSKSYHQTVLFKMLLSSLPLLPPSPPHFPPLIVISFWGCLGLPFLEVNIEEQASIICNIKTTNENQLRWKERMGFKGPEDNRYSCKLCN